MSRAACLVLVPFVVACGSNPAMQREPAAAVMVVPADRVVEKCPCDGADDEAAPPRKVEYVRVDRWESPPSAKRAEELIAANPKILRSANPPPAKLTLHREIPETRIYRLGWGRYY